MLEIIVLINTPTLTKDEFDALIELVSFEKQQKIKRFHFIGDAYNCLLSDFLIRVEICRMTGLSNNQLEFSMNAYGKPFLINNPSLHYNISHSGNYIACAISDEPIGIDIELIKPIDIKIAERFFTPDETAYIMDSKQRIHRFYEIWTKKESRIKWEGQGLHKPLSSFSVLNPTERNVIFYYMVYYDIQAICHVCSNKSEKPSVRIVNTDMLLQRK